MNELDSFSRHLQQEEIQKLEKQGCSAIDWDLILVTDNFDPSNLTNVRFTGSVTIHEGAFLRNIFEGIGGCIIGKNVVIENVDSIEFESEASHGVGTMVSVLDETGSRAIPIYPGISSQIATLMARRPKWLQENLEPTLRQFIDSKITPARIGENTKIKNCGKIKNVSVGNEILIEGALLLENGSVINNAAPGKGYTYIGTGVQAENFILEDGRIESQSIVENCYIGQGVEIAHSFSAHDCLFFANCSLENGEAHSVLGGPYTVSMHKGTLLIGCQTSFMNAGSATNQSNHMYKLGPVHWGLLERGVKTSSGSYLMLGAKIGAFSLLMGPHKTHPDSSEFPFSYLFGDERGNTVVVPGLMLRSCGLLRDELKWPTRDRRLKRKLPLFDHITFKVLNPFTVDIMLRAIDTIDDLLIRPADDDLYMRYKGMKFTRAALERAKSLYTLAIFKYLSITLPSMSFPENDGKVAEDWVDLGGQVLPRNYLNQALESDSITTADFILAEAFENYEILEQQWIGRRFSEWWRQNPDDIMSYAKRFDDMVEDDRQQYIQMLNRERDMLEL